MYPLGQHTFGDRLLIMSGSNDKSDLRFTSLGIKDLLKDILKGQKFISPYARSVIHDKKKKEIKKENIRKIGSLVKRMSQNDEHADKLFDTFKKSKVAQLRKEDVMNARYGIKV